MRFEELFLPVGGDTREVRILDFFQNDLLVERAQRRLGLLARDSRREPREHLQPPAPAILQLIPRGRDLFFHRDRHVQVGLESEAHARETWSGDADDGHRMPVDEKSLTDYVPVAGEAVSPVVVTEDHHRLRAGSALVLGRKDPTQSRPDAEDLEVISGGDSRFRPLRLSEESRVHRFAAPAEHPVEDLVLLPVILVHGIGERVRAPVAPAVGAPRRHHHQRPRIFDREEAQEDLVEKRENRGVRPDSESERKYTHEREHGRLRERTKGHPQVLSERRHESSSAHWTSQPGQKLLGFSASC